MIILNIDIFDFSHNLNHNWNLFRFQQLRVLAWVPKLECSFRSKWKASRREIFFSSQCLKLANLVELKGDWIRREVNCWPANISSKRWEPFADCTDSRSTREHWDTEFVCSHAHKVAHCCDSHDREGSKPWQSRWSSKRAQRHL